jgi:hypothetical protein
MNDKFNITKNSAVGNKIVTAMRGCLSGLLRRYAPRNDGPALRGGLGSFGVGALRLAMSALLIVTSVQ